MQKRIADYGVRVGSLPTGPHNRITDVPGVRVGQVTVEDDTHHTGVTVVLPGCENPFTHKYTAASHVLNGFGKTLGLVQIEELGTLETPIALTNTLNVGLVHDALVEYALQRNAADGLPLRSVNPIVCECNDGGINNIATRAVGQQHVLQAIEEATQAVAEGAVGAGRGMVCHGLKGGVGTASRQIEIDGMLYTLGVLVLCNHGRLCDLQVAGQPLGARIDAANRSESDQGSCIIIVACDLPVDSRQLGRVIRRCSVGLARLGSYIGHGSGEVFVGFTTADPHIAGESALHVQHTLREDLLDGPFRAAAECTEEAVLNAMCAADTTVGYNGRTYESLRSYLHLLEV